TLLCNVTLDAANWQTLQPHLENFIFAMPVKDAELSTFNFEPATLKEGLAIPAQVNYVAKGANLYDHGYELDGSSEVISGYLRMAYLWEKIRVQGGAYGAFAQFDDATGVFSFLSYRDPNLDSTLANYDKAAKFLKTLDASRLNDNELKKAIIAAIGDLDAYQLPDAKGYTSLMRYITGRDDAMRQKYRDEVLSTNGEDFIAFGEVLDKVAKSDAVVVLGPQAALEGAKVGLKVVKVA
ncbi:MAG: peptidase M16, partial [Chloroflexi bacterium]|nr:peptidase M16 [Chloroflexota bacterium]